MPLKSCLSLKGDTNLKHFETSNSTEIYAIYIPGIVSEFINYNDYMFTSKADCLLELRQYKGARFKAFNNKQDAMTFTMYGPAIPIDTFKCKNGTPFKEERPSPFPTLIPQQYVIFRKTIEKGDMESFDEAVKKNPRYLVSKADTPSILKEGPRYNALHIACIHNKPEFCCKILETITDEFFKKIYPDDTDSCSKNRASHLLDLYLNTPDKGFNRTPLHYSSSSGYIDCVKILVSYSNCAKNSVDKYGNTAIQLMFSRASKSPSEEVRAEMEMFLGDHYYVPIFHDEEQIFSPKIAEPMSPNVSSLVSPQNTKEPSAEPLNNSIGCNFSPSYKLHGYAGPMSPQQAKIFHSKWRSPVSSSPVTPRRYKKDELNLERIGRDLAYELNLPWKEYWDFLGEFINIISADGLKKLENHLNKMLNQVLVEKNKLEDSDFLGIDEADCSTVCDNASKNSSLSTIGELCIDFNCLKLNSPTSAGEVPNLPAYEHLDWSMPAINNNINNDIENGSFNYMNYILKLISISSTKISQNFENLSNKKDQWQFCNFKKLNSNVYEELDNLRTVLCRLYVQCNIDLSFVHSVLASNIFEILITNSTNLKLDSFLETIDKLKFFNNNNVIDKQINNNLKCLCTNLTNTVVTYKDNKDIESTYDCMCSWSNESLDRLNETQEGLKYKNAHSFFKRLFPPDKLDPNHTSVVRQLTFLEDDKDDNSSTEEDRDSFETAVSSISDSMATPIEAFSFFIYGKNPTNIDNMVLSAIEKIDIDHERYPFISQWLDVISSYTPEERKSWPSISENKMERSMAPISPFKNVISSTPKLLRNTFYSHFNRT